MDKEASMAHLFPIQFNTKFKVLHRTSLLGSHRHWTSEGVIDALPCGECSAHGKTDEKLRSLLIEFPHFTIPHLLAIEVPMSPSDIRRNQIEGKTRDESQLG